MTADMLYRHMLSMQCRYLKKDMVDSRMKYQETGDSAIRNQVKRTQNTFLHSVKASLFRGFQRKATFYFPNWWYTAPMAIFSFIEEYDFSGKTIVPFCTHGTGGLAGSIEDITATLPDSAEILEPIGIYRPDVDSAQPVINEWLEGLGFEDGEKASNMADGERKLRMIVDGQEIAITLYNTPAANALYDLLPLELTFEDFNGIEKISYLSEELPTDGEPDGCDPDVGDLCLYAPWGNLSIFYQDFRYSESLIMLGHVDSGMDIVSSMEENTAVVLEKLN